MGIDAEDSSSTSNDIIETTGVRNREGGLGEGGVQPILIWSRATTLQLEENIQCYQYFLLDGMMWENCEIEQIKNLNEEM